MRKWYEKTQILLFICIFPAVIIGLMPLPSVIMDFLIFLALVMIFIDLVLRNSGPVFPTLFIAAVVTRMMLCGMILRKIMSLGPAFDGQIIRIIGEIFHQNGFEKNLTFGGLSLLCSSVLFTLMTRKIRDTSQVYVELRGPFELGKIENAPHSGQSLEDAEQRRVVTERMEAFRQYGIVARLLLIEARLGLLFQVAFMIFGFFAGKYLRFETMNQAFRIYALLTWSAVIVLQALALLSLMALASRTAKDGAKRILTLDIRELILEHRKSIVVLAFLLFLLAFVPGFPHILLLSLSGVLAGGCYLLGVAQSAESEDSGEPQEKLLAKAEQILPPKSPVKILFGGNLWQVWYRRNRKSVDRVLERARIRVAKKTGVLVANIEVCLDLKVKSDQYIICINDRRILRKSLQLNDLKLSKHGKTSAPAKQKRFKPMPFGYEFDKRAAKKDLSENLFRTLSQHSKSIAGDAAIELLMAGL